MPTRKNLNITAAARQDDSTNRTRSVCRWEDGEEAFFDRSTCGASHCEKENWLKTSQEERRTVEKCKKETSLLITG